MNTRSPILYGTMLLTGANLFLRLSSMAFQVYLSGKIGPAGIGLLQLVLSVRGLAFTVGSAGVRTCAMYLTAGALGRSRDVRAVLTGCFRYGGLTSGLAALCLWQLAPPLAREWIGDAAAISALRVCAVFLPAACLYGVASGYFTAAGRIPLLVAADILRQCCFMAAVFLLPARWTDPGRACLSVALGDSLASAGGFCVLLKLCRRDALRRSRAPKERERGLYRRILRTALPVGAADSLRAGVNTLENLIIPRRLSLFTGTVDAMADYGVLHGMVFPVLMFPSVILFSLAELLVPEFSRCAAGGRWPRVRYLVRRGLRVSLLFSLLTAAAFCAGGTALGRLLYRSGAAGRCLRLYAPFLPLLYTDAIVDAMCKGLGQQGANARYNLLTSCLDAALLWLLLPRYGLWGYYISFAAAHLVNFALSLRRLLLAAGQASPVPRAHETDCLSGKNAVY